MENELFYTVLGIAVLYAISHLVVLTFLKGWGKMTPYEKFISITGTISIVLMILGSVAN
jgi:hypothetical protein